MNRCSPRLKILVIAPVYFILMAWLTMLFFSRYEYQKGIRTHELKQYDEAAVHLARAEDILPGKLAAIFAPRDLFRIHTALGKTMYQQAMVVASQATVGAARRRSMESTYQLFKKGHDYLKLAVSHDPLSYRTAFWYAKITDKLAILHHYFHPGDTDHAYDALSLFKTAARLRPSGITVRYELAAYFHRHRMAQELKQLVQYIGTIYPLGYNYLKKQTWFDADVRACFRQGCLAALNKGTTPRKTLSILSSMAMADGDVDTSIEYYKKSIAYQPHTNTANTYRYLAGLYLKQGQLDKSFDLFLTALGRSKNLEKEYAAIYSRFRAEKMFDEFINFARHVEEERRYPPVGDMIMVRCFMDMGQMEVAKAKLERMIAKKPTAGAWYLLATLAEKQKDWDGMEIAAQRATVLDSYNSHYHNYFCRSLQRMKKHEQAETAITRAIETSKRKNVGYYNHRAWIRWGLKKYQAAIEDWRQCLELKPDTSAYYFNIARAYHKQKKDIDALHYALRARELNPENKTYRDWILKF